MAKEICITSTPHETRLAILEDDQLTEIYYERENEYTLAGSIYKGRVTRVLPGMQSAFVDLGLERDAFLYVTDFMEEQEDSADFEKVPSGNGGGQRESRPSREPRVSREVEPRESSVSSTAAASPSNETAPGEEDPNGTRRWRGRRGRRRGGRPQGPREAGQGESTPRQAGDALSGLEIVVDSSAPSHEMPATYDSGWAGYSESSEPALAEKPYSAPQREEFAAPQSSSSSQTIVLPGESLSRYGGKPAEALGRQESRSIPAAPVVPVSSYKPSTMVEVSVTGWDGGAELPGETLSRHRRKSAYVDPIPAVPEIVTEAWDSPLPAESEAEVDVPSEGEVAVVEAPVEIFPEPVIEHEAAPIAHDSVIEHPVVEHVEAAEPAAVIQEEHFEPESASASYRIDATGPSEYRVSSVLEPEEIAEPEPVSHISHEPTAEVVVEEAHVEAASEAHLPEIHQETAPSFDDFGASADPLLAGSIPAVEDVAEEAPQVIETEFFDEDDEQVSHSFEPGVGTIEEEIIDEEEYDFEPMHAQGDEHDLEDLEEETLDNLPGADLGEMVRDAHLEQRLGVSPDEAGEEDDSETEYGFAEIEVDEEESEEAGGEQAASSPAPSRRTDDGRRGGRGPRRRGRPNSGGGGGGQSRRASAQLSDLPIISELLKQGQEILVQIAKEPIAKKGARITSHIALPGRFLVFMPTVNHVGVSRKIASDEERQRLKRILASEKGTASGGFIVRTAADGASEDDLRADIRFLINLWTDIKQRADEGKAPALIYHDLNLIERVLRDQVSANFSTIWVDNEGEYERILRFLQRFEPSLVRRVKLYTKETPLFEQFGIQDEISKALKSKVWLKSGGSIVINQTEALVAIDINTGKYVGKTARLEDTILKTNLDAIPEIVRQIRLRDLGGIIVIDFIDMDERKNRHKVMAALEEELKHDRAPSKVLQFNDFGLVAITRKRVKQSLERTLSVQCEVCAGTGMVKSPTTVCNEIYTELRKMQKHLERGDVLLRVNPEVVKTLKASGAKWLGEMEEMSGKTIIVKSDPTLHPEQFDIQ